ncbi:MAG: hypothetical protein JWQ23_981, partial [Herminiimonas sp.]|nr:hypothetical protein [Herminiimonas sp.]
MLAALVLLPACFQRTHAESVAAYKPDYFLASALNSCNDNFVARGMVGLVESAPAGRLSNGVNRRSDGWV